MMREFMFEEEMHQSLACVPMAVRRKLDRVGVKIGLKQWQALGRGECLVICHLPIARKEREALKLFIAEAVERASGEQPKTLAESERAIAEPPHTLPAAVAAAARAEGVRLTRRRGSAWMQTERDARINLGGGARHSHNLAAALAEFAQRSVGAVAFCSIGCAASRFRRETERSRHSRTSLDRTGGTRWHHRLNLAWR
jgi:hypothetical protein